MVTRHLTLIYVLQLIACMGCKGNSTEHFKNSQEMDHGNQVI